jgi:soluble lytic murein transglycosylase-like protein
MRFLHAIRRAVLAWFDLIWHFAHGVIVVVGLLAVVGVAHTSMRHGADVFLPFLRPLTQPLLSWAEGTRPVVLAEEPTARVSPRMQAVAEYVARKYRIADSAALQLVAAAEDAATLEGVDPLLVIAVMGVESAFNPIAQSHMGAKGLMQVIPRWHQDKLEDLPAGILDPATNIRVGARVLKSYLERAENLTAALQAYNGAPTDPDAAYANRVLEEKQRLKEVIRRTRGVPA